MAKQPLQFGGQQEFAATPEALFAAVTEFDSIVRIVPDVESSKTLDDDRLQCIVRPGLSFMRGRLTLTFARESLTPPNSAAIRTDAKGIGIGIGISTSLQIQGEDEDDGSRLIWNATIDQLEGLVATVGASLIEAAAEKVIEQCWQRLRSQLGETNHS